jgi:hypothetical protein
VSVDLVISDARLRDASLVGEFVYRAFRRDDPITLWVVPEADDRPAVLPHYFGAVAADAVEHGVVELGRDDPSGDLLAVAIWFDVPEPEPAPPTEPDDRLTELCGRYAGRCPTPAAPPPGVFGRRRGSPQRRPGHGHARAPPQAHRQHGPRRLARRFEHFQPAPLSAAWLHRLWRCLPPPRRPAHVAYAALGQSMSGGRALSPDGHRGRRAARSTWGRPRGDGGKRSSTTGSRPVAASRSRSCSGRHR